MNPQPDLGVPANLAKECEDLAGGMDQQCIASQPGTALSGHPNPSFFYNKVATALRLSAAMIKQLNASQVKDVPEPPKPEPPTPPAEKEPKGDKKPK